MFCKMRVPFDFNDTFTEHDGKTFASIQVTVFDGGASLTTYRTICKMSPVGDWVGFEGEAWEVERWESI